MVPDYSINDAFKDGFTDGIMYLIRYMGWVEDKSLTDDEILRLAEHLGENKLWMPEEIWAEMIHRNVDRWRNKGWMK